MRRVTYLGGYLELLPVGVQKKKSCIKSILLKVEWQSELNWHEFCDL